MSASPTRAAVIDRARALYEDLHFTRAQEWVDAGGKAVGYLPVYVPREIIRAAGMLPVGIHGGGDQLEIIRGDAFYQSYICHLPRSVVELALSGRLDMLSAVLFPSTCDVIRNLSGMWQMFKSDMYVRYVDLPQIRDPDVALEFWMGELRTLMRDLSEVAGHQTTDEDLRASIAVGNQLRDRILELYRLRRDEPWQVPSEELYLLLRAGEVLPADEFLSLTADYLRAIELDPGRPRDRVRVIVVGAFCEQPPIGLIKTIERAGCYIVDDDLLLGNRLLDAVVSTEGDPVETLARAFLASAQKSSILYEHDSGGKKTLMKQRVDAAAADGILFAAPSFCDPALLDRPMLRAGAEATGIPCIAFKYAENTGQFQQFREQAGTFSDAIKLWGGTEHG